MHRLPCLRRPLVALSTLLWSFAACSADRLAVPRDGDGGRQEAGTNSCARDPECDDGIPCTLDLCEVLDGVGRCRHEPDHDWCEVNGRPARLPEGQDADCIVRRCDPSRAEGEPSGCTWDAALREGQACNNGVYCDGNDTCQSGQCKPLDAEADPCPASLSCDPVRDSCVGCTSDAQCAGTGRPFCRDGEVCVECLNDSDCDDTNPCTADTCSESGDCEHTDIAAGTACPGGNVCDGGGSCVQCISDAQCSGSTPRCNTASNTCVRCLANSDCDDTNPCTNDRCGTDNTCSNPPVAAGATCPGGNVCDGSGNCVECISDAQCSGSTPRCNPASNTCVRCLANSDCDDTNPCTNDRCGTDNTCTNPPLASGTTCPGGNVCDSSGRCVECVSNAQCSGSSTPLCHPDFNTCVECFIDRNCPAGRRCLAGFCE